MVRQKFDDALLKAVDFAFNSLGKSCKQALYFHLKNTFHVTRREIPNKVEKFDNALKSIFKVGAIFLERLILKKLCEELEVKLDEEHVFNFVEAISKVKSMVLDKQLLFTVSGFREEVTVVKKKKGGKPEEN